MEQRRRVAVIDAESRLRNALGLNLQTPPELKCLHCNLGFYRHFRPSATDVTHWCPDRKTSNGFSVDKYWLGNTTFNRMKLHEEIKGQPCPDKNCGRTDGRHTILCKLRPKHTLNVKTGDWRTPTTHHQQRLVRKSYKKVTKEQRSVSPDKQWERSMLSIEERRERRVMLRKMGGILVKSPAHDPDRQLIEALNK